MTPQKSFRQGPVGALMDEYERATAELVLLIKPIRQADYEAIADTETKDPDCRSIQTIMNHVVRSGYGYANYLRKHFGMALADRKEQYDVKTPDSATAELSAMLAFTVETLAHHWDMTEEEAIKTVANTAWGQVYDFEQFMEHAIVHVLRHRRQIERFLIKRGA